MSQFRTPTNPATLRSKLAPTEAELRAEYDEMCADIKATYPRAAAEFNGVPTFDEFKLSYLEDQANA